LENLLTNLNPVQQEIVKDTEGNFLVLAGAGSGKTRVLTHRAAYLLSNGVPPWQILAVTFTNKASKEMRERLVNLAGASARDVWIGTFHGICIRMIARFGSEIGIEKFTIIDDADQKKIMKEVLELVGGEYELDVVKNVISNAKNDLLTPDDLLGMSKHQHEKDLAQIYQAYEDKKTENDYLDYDDCIMKVVHLFNVSPAALDHYSRQFRYVMTDETQDTNKAQFKLLQQLSSHHENLFAVGDTDQSIYGWRGAQIENIINFQNHFPNTKLYKLEQNYRSTGTIVEASNAVVKNNQQRLDKTAFTDNHMGDPIYIYHADDDSREADFVAQAIRRLYQVDKIRWSDVAVLYRTNRQSRAVEVAMTQLGVPYQVVGGHAFYDRKEIKDIVAYLRAVNNGMDVLAFNRIINVPKRGIGDASVGKIQDYANECGIPFPRALESVEDVPKIPKKALNSIKEFVAMMERLQKFTNSEEFSVAELVKLILAETKYMETLNPDKEEDVSRMENIEELINVAGKWDEEVDREAKGLSEFLTETSLVADVDGMEDTDAVTLMTTHACKGLEFPIVFIVGVEESILPHGRAFSTPADMEEERRLMYVAMTRAERKLFITLCKQRYEYGNPRPIYNKPSRFLREIPQRLVKNI
jgi:DNA helicase II / ATP-dependent DNA helicase PcrA